MKKMRLLMLVLVLGAMASADQFEYLYPRFADARSYDGTVLPGGGTTVIIIPEESSRTGWSPALPFGCVGMSKLWDVLYSPDAHFTVRAGDEYLVYGEHALLYSRGDARSNVMIYPEELWSILGHCYRPLSPSTGQVSMEAWFPGMEEPVTSFLTVNDPAMSVVQVLLQRGREAAGSQL
jgi:hypothetical protein